MPSKLSRFKNLSLGAALVLVPGFMAARAPLFGFHPWLVLSGVILAGLFFRFYNRPAPDAKAPVMRAGRGSGFSLPLLCLGAFLAWTLVLLLGHWRYSRAEARVSASGLRSPWPQDDEQVQSDSNGQMFFVRLDDQPAFAAGFTQKHGASSTQEDISAALDAAAGRSKGLGTLLERLKRRRAVWRPALDALNRAEAAPDFSWNIQYSLPLNRIAASPTETLLNVVRGACAEALLQEAAGHDGDATLILRQAQWLDEQLRQQPRLSAVLAAQAMEAMIYDAATPLYRRGHGLVLLQRAQTGTDDGGLPQALAFEGLYGPAAARAEAAVKAPGWLRRPWLDWDLAASLDSGLQAVACLKNPAPACNACFQAALAPAIAQGWNGQSERAKTEAAAQAVNAQALARQQLAWLSFQVGRYKKIHHRWPHGPQDLRAMARIKDPRTGQPFSFKRDDDHFLLGDGDTRVKL
jgi:hypothetical protein